MTQCFQQLAANTALFWWRLRLRDRKAERVAPLKDKPGVTNFAPAPNNSLIAARDVGTDEIYALDWDAP